MNPDDLDGNFSWTDDWTNEDDDSDESPESSQAPSLLDIKRVRCYKLDSKYLYRRAWTEVRLLEAMNYEHLTPGTCYNFLSNGDADMMSYIKVAMNRHNLDYLLVSSWRAYPGDVKQIFQWVDTGRIRHLDFYLSEVFNNICKAAWNIMKDYYARHPGLGRMIMLPLHAKVAMGYELATDYYFTIQASANFNSNPRVENCCITIDKGLAMFYKAFFDELRDKNDTA